MQPREPAQDPASSLFTLDLGTSSNYTRQTVIDTLGEDTLGEDSLVLRLVWAIKGFYME